MELMWDDPEPTFETMASAVERMQIPDLEFIPHREPVQNDTYFRATSSYWRTPPRAFSKFAQLNVNIRERIWGFAITDDVRVIEMRHPDMRIFLKDGRQIDRPEMLVKPRALLLACTESRHNLMKSLREVDLGTFDRYLINFEVDTIYFGPDSYWFHEVLWRPNARNPQQQADYNSRDWEKQAWQRRGEWNHWRSGHNKGEEEVLDSYQNRDQRRKFRDNYHPLLSSEEYECQREQIQNVAFDLEFWEETFARRCGGQVELMSRFPNAKTFVLAAGDRGSAYSIQREDKGIIDRRVEIYQLMLKENKTTKPPGVIHEGQVELHSGAVQTQLKGEVMQIAKNRLYPKIMTMCVSRGGEFKGHGSRFMPGPRQPPLDESDSESDFNYDNEELLPDFEEEPSDLRRIPRRGELYRLYDDLEDINEEKLQEIKRDLHERPEVDKMTVKFHREAAVPQDEDTEDETMDLDEDVNNVPDVEGVEGNADTMDIQEGGATVQSEDAGAAKAVEGNDRASKSNTCCTSRTSGKIKKRSSPKSPTPEKKNRHSTIAAMGNTVVEIIESKVHYSVLTYRVRFQGQTEPDKTRYARTELMFVDNEYCRELIALWHSDNPFEDDLQTEAIYVRKAYGSVTKDGKKIAQGPTPPPTPPAGSTPPRSSSSASASSWQEGEARNDEIDVHESIEVDNESTDTLSPHDEPEIL